MKFVKNKKVYISENIKKGCIIILNNDTKELNEFFDTYPKMLYSGEIVDFTKLRDAIASRKYKRVYLKFNDNEFAGWDNFELLDKWDKSSLKRIDYSLC